MQIHVKLVILKVLLKKDLNSNKQVCKEINCDNNIVANNIIDCTHSSNIASNIANNISATCNIFM